MRFSVSILLVLFSIVSWSQKIEVFTKELDAGKIEVFARNETEFTRSVKITIEQKGMKESVKSPITKVLAAGASESFVILTPVSKKGYQFGYQSTHIRGNVLGKHDNNTIYQLPYPKGRSYNIDQGYNGPQTHRNRNALDFGMDEGTEIAAIRGGVVIEVVEKFNRGCPRQECAQYNNFILVEHEDGSVADYAHLKKNGALVEVGDEVLTGDIIGLSGSTGWATGPHLHLEVYTMGWEGQETVSARYQLNKNKVGIPQEGQTYTNE